MIRWLRVAGGYQQRLDTATTNDGRVLRDTPPMVDVWFGKTSIRGCCEPYDHRRRQEKNEARNMTP